MPHTSSKTYTHAAGLSCCFRQWRAESHCRFLHGYALEVALRFRADSLDERRWVMDFGALGEVKAFLVDTFDHKTLVAADDPELSRFEALRDAGLVDLRVVPHTGCEAFAELVFEHVSGWLRTHPDERVRGRVTLDLVEVREHGGNAAGYSPSPKE
jgi:6-pyruvoyltetrahydropterin/6-carboxytetrahydropterin synthase